MKAALFTAPFEIAVREVPDPVIEPHEVLIQVAACGICGTDLKIESGGYDALYPVIAGHELSGTLLEVGADVTHLKAGDSVAVNPNTPCRRCRYCYRGLFHLCTSPTACGVTYDGGFAQLCKVSAQLALPVSDALPLNLWAMMEPVSCCLHGIDVAGIVPGDSVVILGAGSIGNILAQLARNSGAARVIVSEPREEKRELALAMAADDALDPLALGDGLTEAVHDLTCGGADVVIEAAGIPATALSAISLARRGGTVLFFGVCPQDLEVPVQPYAIFHHELSIKGAYTNPLTDTRAIAMLESGRVQVAPLISHRYTLDQVADGLKAVRAGETVKAQVIP